jgi:hypothetical protein
MPSVKSAYDFLMTSLDDRSIAILQGGAPLTYASPPRPGWVPKGAATLEARGRRTPARARRRGLLSARGEATLCHLRTTRRPWLGTGLSILRFLPYLKWEEVYP